MSQTSRAPQSVEENALVNNTVPRAGYALRGQRGSWFSRGSTQMKPQDRTIQERVARSQPKVLAQ